VCVCVLELLQGKSGALSCAHRADGHPRMAVGLAMVRSGVCRVLVPVHAMLHATVGVHMQVRERAQEAADMRTALDTAAAALQAAEEAARSKAESSARAERERDAAAERARVSARAGRPMPRGAAVNLKPYCKLDICANRCLPERRCHAPVCPLCVCVCPLHVCVCA